METNNRVHNSSCKAILLHCKFWLYTIFFTNTELLHTLGATNPVLGTCTCSGFAHTYGNIKVHFLFKFLVRWWIFIPSLAPLVFQQCPTRPKTTREVTAFSTPLVRRLILLKQGHYIVHLSIINGFMRNWGFIKLKKMWFYLRGSLKHSTKCVFAYIDKPNRRLLLY